MPICFEKLCSELHLVPEQSNPEQLQKLKHWCHHHISTDISYSGDCHEQYERHLSLAKEYLDNFLSKISDERQVEPAFNHMNAIQFASLQGYDHYLNNLTLPKEAWNETNAFGMTALHLAAAKGHVHTVKALLVKGADAQKTNKQLQLPIYSALLVPITHKINLLSKKEELFKLLQAKTPELMKHQDEAGDSILHLMATNGFYSLAKNLLLESNELAFVANNYTIYPIHTAILNQRPKLVRLLLDIKNGATLTDAAGKTSLHYAVLFGTPEIIDLCCEKAADINERDHEGKTPLMLAAETANREALETLLEHNADATLTDAQGMSPLHYAVLTKDESLVEWLLAHSHIDINHKDSHGHTVLSISSNSPNIQELLLNKGARQG